MVARGVVEVAEPSSTAAVGVRKKRGKGGFSSLVFVSSIDNEYLSYFWINMATLNKSKRYFLQIKIRSKSWSWAKLISNNLKVVLGLDNGL